MIYTIGNKKSYMENYNQKLINNVPFKKLGKCILENGESYSGGYAFKTKEDAIKRIDEAYSDRNFSVFGLDADWENDTEKAKDGWWHYLLNTSDLIVLDDGNY